MCLQRRLFGRVYKCRNNQPRILSMQRGSHIIASHQHPFHQHLVADTQGQPAISASNGWAGGTSGGVTNSNQGAPLGLLSMGYFLKHLPPGYPSSGNQESRRVEWWVQSWGLWQEGGHATTPFEVFITLFCHYMIKVITGDGLDRFDKDSIHRL